RNDAFKHWLAATRLQVNQEPVVVRMVPRVEIADPLGVSGKIGSPRRDHRCADGNAEAFEDRIVGQFGEEFLLGPLDAGTQGAVLRVGARIDFSQRKPLLVQICDETPVNDGRPRRTIERLGNLAVGSDLLLEMKVVMKQRVVLEEARQAEDTPAGTLVADLRADAAA